MVFQLYIVLAIEFFAAICGTIYYSKYKHTTLKWILPLLWYIPINEFFCHLILTKPGSEILFYNIYEVVVPLSLLLIIRNQLNNKKRRLIISVLIGLCSLVFIVNMSLINLFKESPQEAFTIAAILIVFALLHYLIESLKSNEIIQPSKDLFLWVTCGFLVFHISYPVITFARKVLAHDSLVLFESLVTLQIVIIFLSYTLIGIGFIYSNTYKPELINKK